MNEPRKKTPYRVLIVDDEPDERDLLAELLSGPNRAVEVCDTAQAALEFLQHNPVDLAFVDYRMPGVNGLELGCPEIRDSAEHVLHKPLNLGEVLQLAEAYTDE
jgi:CheY-like chemotaxis protein